LCLLLLPRVSLVVFCIFFVTPFKSSASWPFPPLPSRLFTSSPLHPISNLPSFVPLHHFTPSFNLPAYHLIIFLPSFLHRNPSSIIQSIVAFPIQAPLLPLCSI
jgi:hypothetical protein